MTQQKQPTEDKPVARGTQHLISAQALSALIQDAQENPSAPSPCILDCRFNLADIAQGRGEYEKAHIPGAHYADLNTALSAPHEKGITGRHPLPSKTEFTEQLNTWGIHTDIPVICYDDSGGCYAARAWWLLQWAGVKKVMVLDGGFKAWQTAHCPVNNEMPQPAQTATPSTTSPTSSTTVSATSPPTTPSGAIPRIRPRFNPTFRDGLYCTADDIFAQLFADADTKTATLIDARAPNRFLGQDETIDPIAGHIPTAICIPFSKNLDASGNFKSAAALRERFEPHVTQGAIAYCGSGVTACHNILACAIADLPWPKLYPGSWSEWITDAERPMILGRDLPE